MTTNPFPRVLATLRRHGWGKGQTRISVARTLVDAVRSAGFPPRSYCSQPTLSIPYFNDAPERTWEDIVLVLKHAERLWDERYGNPTPAGG